MTLRHAQAASTRSQGEAATLLRAALAYALRLRWPVLPLRESSKIPLTPHGVRDATLDVPTIHAWWARWPRANVGIACGPASRLLVVDVDPRNGGDETLGALERRYGPLPMSPRALTGGGGSHLLFRYPGGQLRGALGAGIDLKGARGYVVAPPSIHTSGAVYRWDVGAHPLDTPIANAPPWLLARASLPAGLRAAVPVSSGVDAAESVLGRVFDQMGWLGDFLPGGRRAACCPWHRQHTDGRGAGKDSSCVLFPRERGAVLGAFVCSHTHCVRRTWRDVRDVVPATVWRRADAAMASARAEAVGERAPSFSSTAEGRARGIQA